MSEAELHVLRARLQGGVLNKARRGELFMRPPIGFAYDPLERMILDPDQQIQRTLRMLFDTFQRTGSAMATVRESARLVSCFPDVFILARRRETIILGQARAQSCAPGAAQSAVRRGFRLWSQQGS